MTFRRLVSASIVAGLVALAGVASDAQIGGILKKKLPKTPGSESAATPSRERRPYGAGITDDMIAQYLKAIAVGKEALAKERAEADALKAKADAHKASADAMGKRRAEHMLSTLMETEECKDKVKEKDPRSKEVQRLEGLAEAATNRGDEAKAEEYLNKASKLGGALELDADRACGGKGVAALHDCMEKKKAELAKQGVSEPMLTVQAQGECMQDPSTSGFAGATGASAEEAAASAEEEAATKAARDAMQRAQANADKAGADAAGLTAEMFAMLDHCIRNRVNGGPGCAEDSNIVIDRHREELKRAVGA